MTRIIVYGHSHVWSVRRALRSWQDPDLDFEVPVCGTKELTGQLVYQDHKGADRLNPILAALINRYSGGDDEAETWFVSMVQGNYYNQLGMFVEGSLFDFVLKGHAEYPLAPGAVVLPVEAVREALSARMTGLKSYLPLMARSPFGSRLLVIGTPPPPASDELLAKTLEEQAQEDLLVSPAFVRLKLWHLQNEIVQSYCDGNGVFYLRGDLPGTQSPEGFLLPKHVKDSVHANHFYSRKLLEGIQDYVLAQGSGS